MSAYVNVAVPCPLDQSFTYRWTGIEPIAVGARVRVPFGSRVVTGLVTGLPADAGNADEDKIRSIEQVLDMTPIWGAAAWCTWMWMGQYYAHPIGDTLASVLPALLRKGATIPLPQNRPPQDLSGLARYRVGDAPVAVTPKQKEALRIIAAQEGGLSRQECLESGISSRVLEMLIGTSSILPNIRPAEIPQTLTDEQAIVVKAITATWNTFETHLIDGVTGSGKTEIYLRLIEQALKSGQQALLLVPEISLTPQTCSRLQQRFGDRVGVLHSGLTDKDRLDTWARVRQGEIRVLAGTRSALFTPMPELGLIIIDEEHDNSYRQDSGLRYNARDVAIFLAHKLRIPCILGTATPSAETYRGAQAGRIKHHRLTRRATGAPMPVMTVLDAKSMPQLDGITPIAMAAIKRTLAAGDQAMVYLPRRGFAHALFCKSCSWASECPNCASRMVFHRAKGKLICHHCTHAAAPRVTCPACDGELVQLGAGTERAEALLVEAVGGDLVLRLDTDVISTPDKLEKALSRIRTGEPLVIIGTQIISKGHDFPNVTLTVVTGTDAALFSVESRAMERLAQQIVQVAGRSGRQRQGQVLLQTSQADNPFLQDLVSKGYHHCLESLIAGYESAGLPPVGHSALITVETSQQNEGLDFLDALISQINHPDIQGAFPAVLEKRAGKYRSQAVIISASRAERHKALWMLKTAATSLNTRIRLLVEVDP